MSTLICFSSQSVVVYLLPHQPHNVSSLSISLSTPYFDNQLKSASSVYCATKLHREKGLSYFGGVEGGSLPS